jgi:hypothetical protein
MASIKEQILDYIATELDGLTGVTVSRSRPFAHNLSELPAIVVTQGNAPAEPVYTNLEYINWAMRVHVLIIYNGSTPEADSDQIFIDAYKAVMADRTAGGLAMDIYPSSDDKTFQEGDKITMFEDLTFVCVFRTKADDPEQQ